MRLWHESLLPYLDRQRLLSQHRECCALRGAGWSRKHATVNYVFTHDPIFLVVYHRLVMKEMLRRGYKPDLNWMQPDWRGTILQMQEGFTNDDCLLNECGGCTIYPEHNNEYLQECIQLLRDKEADCDWEGIERYLNEKKI